MKFGLALGWILVIVALYAAGMEVSLTLEQGTHAPVLVGALIYSLSPGGLLVTQAHVWPWLWNPVIVTVLGWPAWAVFGAPGLLLVTLCGPTRRRLIGRLPWRKP